MQDFRAAVEKLRSDAAEAALIRDLATEPGKRETFDRLCRHLNRLADEVEQTMDLQLHAGPPAGADSSEPTTGTSVASPR